MQPSHSDKAANPEVLRWVTELSTLRKMLKGKKEETVTFKMSFESVEWIKLTLLLCFIIRKQAVEVWGGPAPSDPPAQQHTAQKLRLTAGEKAPAGEGPQAPSGHYTGRHSEEVAGEEGRGQPARGHQGTVHLLRRVELFLMPREECAALSLGYLLKRLTHFLFLFARTWHENRSEPRKSPCRKLSSIMRAFMVDL